MPLARWKDLCLDAADSVRIAEFWGPLLGRSIERQDNGDTVLRGSTAAETLWVNAVPEPRVGKNRVHLDVRVRSLQPLLDAGARVLREPDAEIRWTVFADPEGAEFCAFLDADLPPEPPARLFELVVDTADSASSAALAAWWAGALGGRSTDDGRGYWWVEDVPGLPFDSIDVVPVPEPKTGKNRVHWDVTCDDVPALLARGATLLRAPSGEVDWHVLADPQGNEFCAFASAPPDQG